MKSEKVGHNTQLIYATMSASVWTLMSLAVCVMTVVKHPAPVMSQSCTRTRCHDVENDVKVLTNLVDQLNKSLAEASELGDQVQREIDEVSRNVLRNDGLLETAREDMTKDLQSMY